MHHLSKEGNGCRNLWWKSFFYFFTELGHLLEGKQSQEGVPQVKINIRNQGEGTGVIMAGKWEWQKQGSPESQQQILPLGCLLVFAPVEEKNKQIQIVRDRRKGTNTRKHARTIQTEAMPVFQDVLKEKKGLKKPFLVQEACTFTRLIWIMRRIHRLKLKFTVINVIT